MLAPVLLTGSITPARGQATQPETSSQMDQRTSLGGENNGQDFTRPQDLFQVRYLYQTAVGTGSAPGTFRQVTTDTVTLRSDVKFDIASQWQLVMRGDLPFTDKNPLTADNPNGDTVHGLGDASLQAALVRQIDARWAAGAGVRVIAPTGADDLTSGKWQSMPIAGVRYMLPELSQGSFFLALFRYDVSFAGDQTKKNISNLQFAPELNINLPDRWFITFYPSTDIRINDGDPISGQTGRLFLPADVMIGHNLTKDVVMSLEVGVPIIKDYPVYNFKTHIRFNVKF